MKRRKDMDSVGGERLLEDGSDSQTAYHMTDKRSGLYGSIASRDISENPDEMAQSKKGVASHSNSLSNQRPLLNKIRK